MDYKVYIDVFSALLTPIIAVVTTYIAIQQYRSNKLKLRHDLYERRLKVFRATMRFISAAWQSKGFSWEHFREFAPYRNESYFLFDKDIYNYLELISERGVKILVAEEQIKQSTLEEGQSLTHEIRDLQRWFGDEVKEINRRFSKYLSLKALR